MILEIEPHLLRQIHAHGESTYPEEGAGLLLGESHAGYRRVTAILVIANAWDGASRHDRFLITSQDMLLGEHEAAQRGLDVIGIFHSHPDHPNEPSEFDREWALPWYSYVITTITNGKATGSRSWRLSDDRITYTEEQILVPS